MKCARCKKYPATSIATGLCSLCLYAENMGDDRAQVQERRYLKDEAMRKDAARRKDLKERGRGGPTP